MGIEVRHEQNGFDATLQATLAYLLAQRAAEQEAEQAAPQGIMEQLAPLLAARGQPQPNALEDSGVPTYGVRPRDQQAQYSRAPSYRSPGRAASRRLSSIFPDNRDAERYEQQNQLAEFRAKQEAKQRAAQLEREQLQQEGTLARQLEDDIPPDVQQALQAGTHAYSQRQKQLMQSSRDRMTQVDNDPRFSPAEKEQVKNRERFKYQEIANNPDWVPFDQRPVSPQQEFEQGITMRPFQIDENTTLQLPYRRKAGRAGQPGEFVMTDEGMFLLKKEEMRIANRYRLDEINAQNAAKPPVESPQQKAFSANQEARRTAERNRYYTSLNLAETALESAEDAAATAQDELDQVAEDDKDLRPAAEAKLKRMKAAVERAKKRLKAANKNLDDYNAKVDAAMGMDIPGVAGGLEEGFGGVLAAAPAASMTQPPTEDPSAFLDEGQPPLSGGPPVAITPADVQRMYADGTIPIGGQFIGPDGQLHTRAR